MNAVQQAVIIRCDHSTTPRPNLDMNGPNSSTGMMKDEFGCGAAAGLEVKFYTDFDLHIGPIIDSENCSKGSALS